ncbi:MAG: GIY-YIG nuclease family protein [Parasphingopyxis sp.]|jgi:predicted GIY-YIG superfamily endonuclease|uniref:GIY-YIG nuclease family protein n=1 Tax=Parasphingopyxis sp. TaxID=1920299 RepID=UPI003FA1869E
MTFWTYLLKCSDGRFYAGHTDDLDRRISEHQSGLFTGYTYRRRPVELVWQQDFPARDQARAAERQIKGWRREKKQALIDGDWDLLSELSRTAKNPTGRSQT